MYESKLLIKEVIQYTVHSFYIQWQYPTLTTALAKLKEDGILELVGFVYGGFCESCSFHTLKGTVNNIHYII